MAASLSYIPEPHEQAYYLGLFRAADVQGTANIGGAQAVQFFARSKLPVEVLKKIWTVADQPSTSSLNHKKFAVALRLIQLTQNGQKGKGQNLATPPGVVLKPVHFEGVSGVAVQMPQAQPQQQQGGMPPPQPTPQQPQRAMPPSQSQAAGPPAPTPTPQRQMQQQPQSTQMQPHQTPSSPSRALVGMDPYSLSVQERSRYESLFPSYAKTEDDGSQFVYGSEAVPLFMKSGVDPNHLRNIWNMVDRDPVDNRLDKLEFALAMHLIVCVSKKNLPMPTGGALPNSLQALKVASKGAPAAPATASPILAGAAPPPQQPVQMQLPPPQAEPAGIMGTGAGGPPPLGGPGGGAMGGMNISDAFEGLSTTDSGLQDYSQPSMAPETPPAPAPALPSYVPDVNVAPTPAVFPEPPTPQPQPTYVHQAAAPQPTPVPETIRAPAPMAATAAAVGTYEVSDSHQEELDKLKNALQKLQAENISLKAQLGNMTEEEKQVQQELGQTVTEITALSTNLGAQRQQVLDAKNRLLEAKAELKAQRETKGVLTELISEAKETADAIDGATETIRTTAEVQSNPVAETADLFDMSQPQYASAPQPGPEGFANEFAAPPTDAMGMAGGVASISSPPPQPAGDILAPGGAPHQQPPQQRSPQQMPQQQPPLQQMPIPETPSGPREEQPAMMYANYAAAAPPPQGGYQAPVPQQQTPVPQRQAQMLSPIRQPSGFASGFVMGGAATAIPQKTPEGRQHDDDVSQAARSYASTGDYGYDDKDFEIVENMKKKAASADGAALDAEAASRKLAAEADELRTDADRADANSRTLAAAAGEKKKGRFKGGKKKKMKEEAEQAAKDAELIKSHFLSIQSRALEAQTLAAQTRAQADKLRDEAEAAELKMAAEASKKQKQPAPAPVPTPAYTANGYGVSPKPNYGMTAPPRSNGYGAPPPQPVYGGMPQPSLAPQYVAPAMPPPNPSGGGYGNSNAYTNGNGAGDAYAQPYQPMSLPDPSTSATGVMGNGGGDFGGYDMPSPAAFQQMAPGPAAPATGGDPYQSPF